MTDSKKQSAEKGKSYRSDSYDDKAQSEAIVTSFACLCVSFGFLMYNLYNAKRDLGALCSAWYEAYKAEGLVSNIKLFCSNFFRCSALESTTEISMER